MKNTSLKAIFVILMAFALVGSASAFGADKIILGNFGDLKVLSTSTAESDKIVLSEAPFTTLNFEDLAEKEDVSEWFIVRFDGSITQQEKEELFFEIEEKSVGDILGNLDNTRIIVEISEVELVKLSQEWSFSFEKLELMNTLLPDAVESTDANDAWTMGYNGQGGTICVIDTGVDFTHPDLAAKNALGGNNNVDCHFDSNLFNEDCLGIGPAQIEDGHGTHVAGIAGAAGGIDGIGKGVNLIGLNVRQPDNEPFMPGEITTTGIEMAIKWCVQNAVQYDISAISISLGTDSLYTQACDSGDGMRVQIIEAFNAGIPTTAGTGNDGSTSGITKPACYSESIPVSATWKTEEWAPYANYNSLVELFAVGGRGGNGQTVINSTAAGGGYDGRFGTSMSTPMVAAAMAILKQALSENNLPAMNPHELEDLLHQYGTDVTGLPSQYKLIDIGAALDAVVPGDLEPPVVTLISPEDGSWVMEHAGYEQNNGVYELLGETTFDFECRATDDMELQSLEFFLYNSQQEIVFRESRSVSGVDVTEIFEVPATTIAYMDSDGTIHRNDGIHDWNCEATDMSDKAATAPDNWFVDLVVLITVLIGDGEKKEPKSFRECRDWADCRS